MANTQNNPRLSKWTDSNIRLSSLDRHTVSQLMYPLLRLRQACCHPQAVRGEFLPIHKSTMTMEELLESLTKKAKLEAEESHRALVAAINGEAGLYIINEQFVEAVEKYRDVLRSVEEHKDTLKTDTLQQLHAMYNLSEVLKSKPEGVAPTLRDDLLPKQIDELRDKYMAKAIAFVKSTEEALAPAREEVKQLQRECTDTVKEWWFEVIQWAVDRELDDKLVLKVREDLSNNATNPGINTLVRSCRSVSGLEYAVHTQLSGMETSYQAVLNSLKGLEGVPSQDLINNTVECCLRPEAGILKKCPFCKCEDLLETFEAKLFSFVEKGIEHHLDRRGYQVNTKRKGTWADSEAEKALRSIMSFAKHYRVSEEVIENGTLHIKLIEAMKKEFKKLRARWAGIKEHVGAFDELDMSTTRLRLLLPGEPVPKKEKKKRRNNLLDQDDEPKGPDLNVLEKSELSQHKLKLVSDRIIAQAELRKKLGQLLYLTNLAKNQTNNADGSNPEPCPICQQELGKEWSVMQCGHCYCIECVRILVERASFGRRNFTVKCAICRQNTHQGEISYVMTSRELHPDDIGVKGSHSTKVEAVVRCLLQIQKENPTSESLVFSTWTDVLSVIATALEENDIKYKALYSAGKFQENLTSFRQEEDVTTLLLPVHSGANGLNLIEATNVLLVEPILNPAHELQAIGRVHRIGQTKSTHVHRFLIRNTIEQKMHILLETMDKHNILEKSEESGLTIGDLSSLFTQQMEEEDREGVDSLDEDERSSPHRESDTVNGSSLTEMEIPSTSISVELETPSTSSSSELETPSTSRSAELETPSTSSSSELETPSTSRSAELETPSTSSSSELETPSTSRSAELETPSTSSSSELETPSTSKSAELETKSTSRSTELETPSTSRSTELETPSTHRPGELETPSTSMSGKLETPCTSRSTELETPSTHRPGELETPSTSMSGELDTPSTSMSGELDTPSGSRSTELETPCTSMSAELETPSTHRPRVLEAPCDYSSTEFEVLSNSRLAELDTSNTSRSAELETPSASRSGELCCSAELNTPTCNSNSVGRIVRSVENCAEASTPVASSLRFDIGSCQEAVAELLGNKSESQFEYIQR